MSTVTSFVMLASASASSVDAVTARMPSTPIAAEPSAGQTGADAGAAIAGTSSAVMTGATLCSGHSSAAAV